jgi:bacterioferritin-associated ferredoxin
VYICLCNALTDRQVRQAADTVGSVRPSDVYAACGCRAQCGNCAKKVLCILRELAAGPRPVQQGAD